MSLRLDMPILLVSFVDNHCSRAVVPMLWAFGSSGAGRLLQLDCGSSKHSTLSAPNNTVPIY